MSAHPLAVIHERPQQMVDHGRRLTEHKHTYDPNEDERDVLLVAAFAHLGPLTLPLLQRLDEFHVEEAKAQEGSAVHDDDVEYVGVQDPVNLVAPEGVDVEAVAGLVLADAVLDFCVLEEARNVVDDSEDDNGGDVHPHLGFGARPDRTVRAAHGEVSLQRHEHGQEDGARVRDKVTRPQIRHSGVVEVDVGAQGASQLGNGGDDVERYGGDEDERVSYGHRPKEERRCAAASAVSPQDRERDGVADQPECTQRARRHGVDEEVKQSAISRHAVLGGFRPRHVHADNHDGGWTRPRLQLD